MTWNPPGNNENDRDQWSNRNNNSNINMNYDSILRKLNSKLSWFGSPIMTKKIRFYILGLITLILIWACSGFYTIKEAERGVVLRLGKFDHIVTPGLNWKPTLIDTVTTVNVESVRELAASGVMLTSDENVVRVEMNVQYRITDPKQYLFSVTDADDSLRQATDSALRGVIGKYTMDRILTEGRTVVRSDTQHVLEDTILPYNIGITLLDVNFQAARPPEEVKAAFDDAIAARENEQQYIREAEAYANEVQPRANGKAQRILEEGRAYKTRTILEAEGEVKRFSKVLPEYKAAPEVTRERLYIDAMENMLSKNNKIIISEKNSNVMMLPINYFLKNSNNISDDKSIQDNNKLNIMRLPVKEKENKEKEKVMNPSKTNTNTQRYDINRDDIIRQGR
ncbi:FtsH protease activity modulator HflK [Candidatus Palibaumannia cicadellinicola]|uniref:Protein HflK n=1 Tax=Candidatus Palibaumannia cicadellinicola TaxID=186490 RepID=A0A0K2BL45_9GAMM|nr:FtsH protease activity modulator HflK [Candidatus Baumannia cicadellinicola]AKZ66106.1 HflK protein [Candidatus Baumannia cicadellinicola]